MDKILKIAFIFFTLFVILIASIKSTFEGYYRFYYAEKKYEECSFSKLTNNIFNFYPLHFFETYTGFETGYGFFGPNVSSECIFIFKIYDNNGNLVKTSNEINIKSKESKTRLLALNTIFIKMLDKSNTTEVKYRSYLDVIVNQISKHVKSEYPSNYKIETSLYLFDYPNIKNFKQGKKQKIFLIKNYSL